MQHTYIHTKDMLLNTTLQASITLTNKEDENGGLFFFFFQVSIFLAFFIFISEARQTKPPI